MTALERASDYLRQAGGGAAQDAREAIARGDVLLAYAMVRALQTDPDYRGNLEAACVDFARRELRSAHTPESPKAGDERLRRWLESC